MESDLDAWDVFLLSHAATRSCGACHMRAYKIFGACLTDTLVTSGPDAAAHIYNKHVEQELHQKQTLKVQVPNNHIFTQPVP